MSSIGPAIRLPLFDAGRLRANYAGKASDIDLAIAQYNQSVLGAAQDVAEQLTRIADLGREEAATRNALNAAEEAHRLATLRYRGGLSPYLTVLTVETQLLTQRRAMAALKARRDDLQVSLVRALGGGFATDTAPLAANR
jgi:outer membrane protein TolC